MEQAFNSQAKVKSPALRPPLQRCSSFKIAHTPCPPSAQCTGNSISWAAAAAQSQVLNNETVVGYYVYVLRHCDIAHMPRLTAESTLGAILPLLPLPCLTPFLSGALIDRKTMATVDLSKRRPLAAQTQLISVTQGTVPSLFA